MLGYGLDRVEVHRFQSNTAWSVNICGYKTGSVYPDEWLIFGAHFDIAPPVAYTPGAEIGIPGYGTRHGAYDNAAGSSMVLSTASVLAEFDARRTMVFCLWSSEEEGLWGSRSFAGDIPDGVTVSNYLNLDMAGVNYPETTLYLFTLAQMEPVKKLISQECITLQNGLVQTLSTLVMKWNVEEKHGSKEERARFGETSTKTLLRFTNLLLQEVTTNPSKTSALLHSDGMDWLMDTHVITGNVIPWIQ